jgi:2-isopropylmalate synthase
MNKGLQPLVMENFREEAMKPTYAKMSQVQVSAREWPSRKITVSPEWCAVDLRDGNQALPNPMTPEQKLEYFKLLVDIGFKQIEVGFPSASEDDFSFCRKLIEDNLIPDDVVISVLVQAREHLIDRTIEALKGAKTAVVHLYIATSELHRKFVFGLDEASVTKTAVDSTLYIKKGISKLAPSKIGFEFSPEEFTDTELDFSINICEKVLEAWNPAKGEKVIINLPMTVERRMPNEYADMIEEFIRKYKYTDRSIISLHAHNDMGSAVASSMMALLAGAQRVEGTLLGHGERTGNLDLITFAMNLTYMNIDTGLNFENLPVIVATVERVTGIPVHARHPYSGELVFTAFSGSHQDAINKGLARRDELATRFGGWKIPYLHVDPSKLGRSFEKFIRINSQSGKGGIAFVMERDHQVRMPKWMHSDFAAHVQRYADEQARELGSDEVFTLFKSTYFSGKGPISLVNYWPRPSEIDPAMIEGELHIKYNDTLHKVKAQGNGPISALVRALKEVPGLPSFTLENYEEESMGTTDEADAVCFVRIKKDSSPSLKIGVGTDPNVIQAATKAVINGLNAIL